ncbi:hypothetical protein K1B34_002966 [Vibrio parahaemolyticus]|nr:hypothetical protein [Vibrio parahaemolyticus]
MPAIKIAGFSSSRGIDGVFILFILSFLYISFMVISGNFKSINVSRIFCRLLILPLITVVMFFLRVSMLNYEIEMTLELIRLFGAIKIFLILMALYLYLKDYEVNVICLVKAICYVSIVPFMVGIFQGLNLFNISLFLLEFYPRGSGLEATELVLKFGRAFSIFDGQPNNLGFYSAFIILIIFVYKPFKVGCLAFTITFMALTNLYFSESRGAMLSLIISLLMSCIIKKDIKMMVNILFVSFLGLVVMFMIGFDGLDERVIERFLSAISLSNLDGTSIYSARMEYWSIIYDRLLELKYFSFGIPSTIMVPVDNLLLFIFSYQGVIAGILYVGYLLIFSMNNNFLGEKRLACCLCIFIVNGISMPTLHAARISELFWLILLVSLMNKINSGKVNI